MSEIDFRTPGTIISGPGCCTRVAEEHALRTCRRVLVVTDRNLNSLGFAERITKPLERKGVSTLVYDEVEPEPSAATVRKATAMAAEEGVDGVIGIGGGSPLDVAKLVALFALSPQPIESTYGVDLAKGSRLPLVLLPTTAGTGSEVTKVAVVTGDGDDKNPILAPQLICDAVYLDAELTLGLPSKVTAATGVDAMVHAIESYTSAIRKNAVSDQMALQAMQLLYGSINTATGDGTNLKAREDMLAGSMLAGLAFANATVGGVHALAYPIGTKFHVSHGASNALVLVPVMRFNMPEAAGHYAEIARSLIPGLELASDEESAGRLIDSLEQLIVDVGLENRLSDFNIGEKDIPKLTKGALRQERILSYNFKTLRPEDISEVFLSVL
jgi:alcohol dehydrogenase class IV